MRIDGPQITGSFSIGETTFPDLSALATTGSNLFKGTQTISGSLIPAVDNVYDLGDSTHQYRHLYLSSGSLYIDGVKVLGSTTQELQITTDSGQSFKILEGGSDTITLQSADGNVTLATSGGGDVILDPTTGIIALKGTTQVYSGNKVRSSDGNNIVFGDGLTVSGSMTVTGFIETQELKTTYISSSILYRSGSTKFGDELTDTHAFSGSVLISGSLSVPGSGLVSGSSQIIYSGLTSIPSGIVSGSVQVDVMSTTNIARLATTGSNSFNGNQTITGSIGINVTPNASYGLTIKRTVGSDGALRLVGNDNVVGNSGINFYNDNTTSGSYISMYTNGGLNMNGVMAVTGSNVGVGYGDPQYNLQVLNSIGLRANSQNFQAIKGTGWGYSPGSYRVVMLGDSDTNKFTTVSIGYDPSGNSNGAFNGNGTEVLFRNGASFATPTSANTSFHLNTFVMKDGKIGLGTDNPTGKLHVYNASTSDTYLETGTSGTSGKLIFKTSDNSDLNKYIAQESYYMMFSGNANEGFKWRDSSSNILMSLFGSSNAYGSRLGIGTQTPAHSLDVNGNIRINQSVAYLYFTSTTTNRYLAYNAADTYWRADGVHYFEKTSGYKGSWDANGNLTVTGTITESSAERYKENIKSLENSLDKIIKLRGVSYNKIETGDKEIGLIAEEVNEILPELITKNTNGEIESVAYGRVVSVLIEAIKELKYEIEELKSNL